MPRGPRSCTRIYLIFIKNYYLEMLGFDFLGFGLASMQ